MSQTSWEIKQRCLVDMAADRGAYIDQSQSFNVFMGDPTWGKLSSLHFHCWKQGLKTGLYYLRTRAAADAVKFTVDQSKVRKPLAEKPKNVPEVAAKPAAKAKPAKVVDADAAKEAQMAALVCSLENKDACLMCGS